MISLLKKNLTPDLLRTYIAGNLLIVGKRGTGVVAITEIVKNINIRYSKMNKVTISPRYNKAVDVVKGSFGIPFGDVLYFDADKMDSITSRNIKPCLRGMSISLSSKPKNSDYDKLVSNVVSIMLERSHTEPTLLAVMEIDRLEQETIRQLAELSKINEITLIASAGTPRVKMKPVISISNQLLITSVTNPRTIFRSGLDEFPIEALSMASLTAGVGGEYSLLTKNGRFFKSRVKATANSEKKALIDVIKYIFSR